MINLIPNQEKKKKVKDFYFRFIVVLFIALGFCVLFAAASILPSYFISSTQKESIEMMLKMQKNTAVLPADQEFFAIEKDLNEKISLIENTEKSKYLVSQNVINKLIMLKTPDIKINRINYENNPQKGKKINVYGLAPNRERLLLFRLALEGDISFKSVNLPISSFVKGSNIEFYLSLIPS